MSDETGPELHDRAARGEFLTQDERDVLEAWYSEQDEVASHDVV